MHVILSCIIILLCFTFARSDCVDTSSISYTSTEEGIKLNGMSLSIRGANWFGMEYDLAPGGLDRNTIAFYLDFLKTNGFNAIRLPFAASMVLNPTSMPANINYQINPSLSGLTGLEVLDAIFDQAAQSGILILLDQHRLEASTAFNPLWYDNTYSEQDVIRSWSTLVGRYSSYWNFLGCDLMNEPHEPATWGTGDESTDWNLAAQRIGNAILAQNPSYNGLIFIEGIDGNSVCVNMSSAAGASASGSGWWWGGDMEPVRCAPIALSNMQKLVYSPHVYGPSVYVQSYFSASNFPANMIDIWDAQFSFVPSMTGQAMIIGEWGGPLTGSTLVWSDAFVSYLVSKGPSHTSTFYWALNPNPGGDTDGLLNDDWQTPNAAKMDLLNTLMPQPTTFQPSASNQVCVSSSSSSATSSSSSTSSSNAVATPAPAASPSTPSTSAAEISTSGSVASSVSDTSSTSDSTPASPIQSHSSSTPSSSSTTSNDSGSTEAEALIAGASKVSASAIALLFLAVAASAVL